MDALVLVLGVGAALIVAYVTYGRWVAGRVFTLREDSPTPATVLCDNRDYCPTPKSIVFGHHFTSIAGTGPIVGPAIAVMWGWLPAVLWVVFGSVFIGAVHDLGSIVVSLRNNGRSVGDIAGDLLGPRIRLIFLGVLVMALWIVLAIFGLVVASVLRQYPGAIVPVLVQIPLAVVIGLTVHRAGRSILAPSMVALAIMYASVIWGDAGPLHAVNTTLAAAPMWAWVVGLLAYAYIASVLPVWTLLQPRDYINSLQLLSALGLLVVGLAVAATIGGAPDDTPSAQGVNPSAAVSERESPRPPLEIVAPMVQWQPEGAPPLLPVLFITIACGAVSGFHCLVGSGTTSKQIAHESDARAIGYGSMLTEAFLATLVIAACAAGIGLGISKAFNGGGTTYGSWTMKTLHAESRAGDQYQIQRTRGPAGGVGATAGPSASMLVVFRLDPDQDPSWSSAGLGPDGTPFAYTGRSPDEHRSADRVGLTTLADNSGWAPVGDSAVNGFIDENLHIRGPLAWDVQYQSWSSAQGLANTVGAFVEGAANLIKALGVPGSVAVALMGVLVASFAGTTMDTACRLQRYVIQELARTFLPRPPSPCCHRCGYDLRGHAATTLSSRDAGSESAALEGPDDSRHQASDQPGSTLRSDSAPAPVTCPECGAENRWRVETGAHPPERTPEALSLNAMIRHASPMNPARWLATVHGATLAAVLSAVALAAVPAPGQPWSLTNFGQGGLILWPLFGATNQLLGGLAFLVIGAWLIATKRPWWFITLPAVFMLIVPAWALVWQTFIGNDTNPSWLGERRWMLAGVAVITIALEAWLVAEVALRALRASRQDSASASPAPDARPEARRQ